VHITRENLKKNGLKATFGVGDIWPTARSPGTEKQVECSTLQWNRYTAQMKVERNRYTQFGGWKTESKTEG
jgi:hypothetical protein